MADEPRSTASEHKDQRPAVNNGRADSPHRLRPGLSFSFLLNIPLMKSIVLFVLFFATTAFAQNYNSWDYSNNRYHGSSYPRYSRRYSPDWGAINRYGTRPQMPVPSPSNSHYDATEANRSEPVILAQIVQVRRVSIRLLIDPNASVFTLLRKPKVVPGVEITYAILRPDGRELRSTTQVSTDLFAPDQYVYVMFTGSRVRLVPAPLPTTAEQ